MTAVCSKYLGYACACCELCGDRNRRINPNHWAFEYCGFRVRILRGCVCVWRQNLSQSSTEIRNTLTFIHRKCTSQRKTSFFLLRKFHFRTFSLSLHDEDRHGPWLTDIYIRLTENEIKNFVMSVMWRQVEGNCERRPKCSFPHRSLRSIFCVRFSGPFADRAVASPTKVSWLWWKDETRMNNQNNKLRPNTARTDRFRMKNRNFLLTNRIIQVNVVFVAFTHQFITVELWRPHNNIS